MSKSTADRLKDAGAVLFAARGYGDTTVGDIEGKAGLSPRAGGFYRHFKSKQALLIAIAADRFETPEALGLTEVFPLGDTRAELVYIARAYDRLNRADDMDKIIRVEAGRIPELKEMIAEANNALATALTDWIAQKPALEGRSRVESRESVLMIFGSWLFFQLRRDELGAGRFVCSEKLLTRWADFWAPAIDGKNTAL